MYDAVEDGAPRLKGKVGEITGINGTITADDGKVWVWLWSRSMLWCLCESLVAFACASRWVLPPAWFAHILCTRARLLSRAYIPPLGVLYFVSGTHAFRRLTVSLFSFCVQTYNFYTTEVQDTAGVTNGDDIDFVVVRNKLTGAEDAARIRRAYARKAKVVETNFGPIRQPRGPEGKGFAAREPMPTVVA